MSRVALLLSVLSWSQAEPPAELKVGPVPEALRAEWKLSPFYGKYLDAGGMAIVSSGKVHDEALIEARAVIFGMIGHRPELLAEIGRTRVRLAIMAPDEFTTDVPEHGGLRPREYWDQRARGLGAQPSNPCVSCGEENLLGLPGDPYAAESILVHEFAHAIHHCALHKADPTFDGRLEEAFQAARKQGLWKGKYAGTHRAEYWAEGVQSWFDDNRTNDHDHNHVHLRSQLKEYDPGLAALCAEVLGDREWRYLRPEKRMPPAPHLAKFDRSKAVPFSWKELERQQKEGLRGGGRGRLALRAPEEGRDWRSPGSDRKVRVDVANLMKKNVEIHWIDPEGRARKQVDLRLGSLRNLATFSGHVFRVQLEDGTVLGYFAAGEEDGEVVLRDERK